ncbi:hypothetical protein [uncultured Shewanella sp.]|uniref:hypothetical protein n=1 Tax=uncultured Shewanella sp. TaxID=173975 RepID=UPI00262414BF|nr:hypothetical protein [uncultured Shewanella sp.]
MLSLNKLKAHFKLRINKTTRIKISSKKTTPLPKVHLLDSNDRKLLTFKKNECEYLSRYKLEMEEIYPVGCDIFIFTSDFKQQGVFNGYYIYDQISSDHKLTSILLKIKKENNLFLVKDENIHFSSDISDVFDHTITKNEYIEIKKEFKKTNNKYIGKEIIISPKSNIKNELDNLNKSINLLYIDTSIDTARLEAEINKIKRHKYLIYFKNSGYEKEMDSLNLEWT